MKLIVGLGNPGPEYETTRHNFGFLVLDELARRMNTDFGFDKKFKGDKAQASHSEQDKVILLKPLTYMNLSGESAAPLARFFKLPPEDVLVVYDDLDLPLGRLRFASKGGTAGHNGMKSMVKHLGTQTFPRLKLGIGRPVHPGMSPADYVLQRFAKDEGPLVEETIVRACEGIESFLDSNDLDDTMAKFNASSSRT